MNILVTGASKGIGKAIAQELQTCGKVFGVSRNEDALKNLNLDGYFVCDMAKESELIKLGNFIETNKIDVLVNNAGEYIYSSVSDTNLSELEHIFALNTKAPIYLTSRAVNYMKEQRFGRIVNVGSISGVMGEAYASLYSASKAALIGFSKAAGLELAEFGITVNTINPGWVDTELGRESIEDSEFSEREILETVPQKRFVAPKEVAGLVKYLISDEAKGITGQSINLCAGLSVGI